MQRVASGFSLAEAPVITPRDELLVSDVLTGGVRRFHRDGIEGEPLLERRRGIGGMGVRPDGSVVLSGRDLAAADDHGHLTVITGLIEGGTGYNDLAIAGDGSIVAGMLTCHPMSGGPLTPGALVVVDPHGVISSAPLPFCWPNGIGFSPAGDRILIADFDGGVVHTGAWTGGVTGLALQPWCTSPTGDADGLAVTDDGWAWVAGGAGGVVLRCDPNGAVIDQLDVPDDFVSSCCEWPGLDRLVVTTGTSVFFHELV